jgi:hypothetical protein
VLTTGPTIVARGIALLPPAPATLFWDGLVTEQSLAVHVRGLGLVLVTGCGHPGTTVLLDLAAEDPGLPVHAVVGGLHLPVHGYPGIALFGALARRGTCSARPTSTRRSARSPGRRAHGRAVAARQHAVDEPPLPGRLRRRARTLRVGEPLALHAP